MGFVLAILLLLCSIGTGEALNLTGFHYGAPLLIDSDGNGDRSNEPISVDLNITCLYENRSDLRIAFQNESFISFRRYDNNSKAIIKVNASDTQTNDYWLYCYNDDITDANDESFFRVFDDFKESVANSNRWKVTHNSTSSYGLSHNAVSDSIQMITDPDSGQYYPVYMIYNESGGYYNQSSTLYYSAIAYINYEGTTELTLPHRYVGMSETNIVYQGKSGGNPNPQTGGAVMIDSLPELVNEDCDFELNATVVYDCADDVLDGIHIISFYKNPTDQVEYLKDYVSKHNTTQQVNNTNFTAFFMTDYANADMTLYKVAMDTGDFRLYQPESLLAVGAEQRVNYNAPNISSATIPTQTYYENDSIAPFILVSDADNDSMRVRIDYSTSSGTQYSQFISSVTSFEGNKTNGWSTSGTWTYTSNGLHSEGSTRLHTSAGASLFKNFANLSSYNFLIFDINFTNYQDNGLDNKIRVYLNSTSTTLLTLTSTQETYNQYVNLSAYGGEQTLYITGVEYTGESLCLGGTCPDSSDYYLDNLRLGGLTDNNEFNISSNTNVTALLPVDLNIFDVNETFSVVFNVSDDTGNWTTAIANNQNISNRVGTITSVTLAPTPLLESQDIYVDTINLTDPDDGQTNVSQECHWYRNGNPISTNCTLGNGNYSNGDIIRAEVRVSDGFNLTGYTNSSNVTVGDIAPPVFGNFTIPSTGIQNDALTITAMCQDALSEIAEVTINMTDPSGQKSIQTLTSIGSNTYRLLYFPGATGTYTWNGSTCTDTSGNVNYTAVYATTQISPAGSGDSGGGGGGVEIINKTVVKKPENESFFFLTTPTGAVVSDLIMLPDQNRTIVLQLRSNVKETIQVRLLCEGSTPDTFCDEIFWSDNQISLDPLETLTLEVQVNTRQVVFGETAESSLAARLIGEDGNDAEPVEQSAVRLKVTVSRYAYVFGYGSNLLESFDLGPVVIPKAVIFLLFATVVAVISGLILNRIGWPILFFFLAFLLISILDYWFSV